MTTFMEAAAEHTYTKARERGSDHYDAVEEAEIATGETIDPRIFATAALIFDLRSGTIKRQQQARAYQTANVNASGS